MKSIIEQISVPVGAARRGPREAFTLAIDELHPSIRIAHRRDEHLHIPERVIFDHEFVLILKGEGDFVVNRRRYELRPHRLFFIRPYIPHWIESTHGTPSSHVAIHLDLAPGFPAFAHQLSRRPPYEVRLSHGLTIPTCIDLAASHPVEKCLLDILHVRAAAAPTAPLEASTLLLRAILLLLKGNTISDIPGDHRNQARMQRVTDHIQKHSARRLPIHELAEVAGLSPNHLTRLFAQWAGQTPGEYVRQVRIDKARALLADVDRSIKQIAMETGFKSPYHFSRVFRQIDGLTPTLYREALLAGRGG